MTPDRCISCGWRTLKPDPDGRLRCTRAVCGWREPFARRAGGVSVPAVEGVGVEHADTPGGGRGKQALMASNGQPTPGPKVESFQSRYGPDGQAFRRTGKNQYPSPPPPLSIVVDRPPTLAAIVEATCGALAVPTEDLYGQTRHRAIVIARTIITGLARSMTTLSYPEISAGMQRPSHSAVMDMAKRFATLADYKVGDYIGDDPAVPPDVMGKTVKALALEIAAQIGGA